MPDRRVRTWKPLDPDSNIVEWVWTAQHGLMLRYKGDLQAVRHPTIRTLPAFQKAVRNGQVLAVEQPVIGTKSIVKRGPRKASPERATEALSKWKAGGYRRKG